MKTLQILKDLVAQVELHETPDNSDDKKMCATTTRNPLFLFLLFGLFLLRWAQRTPL